MISCLALKKSSLKALKIVPEVHQTFVLHFSIQKKGRTFSVICNRSQTLNYKKCQYFSDSISNDMNMLMIDR